MEKRKATAKAIRKKSYKRKESQVRINREIRYINEIDNICDLNISASYKVVLIKHLINEVWRRLKDE